MITKLISCHLVEVSRHAVRPQDHEAADYNEVVIILMIDVWLAGKREREVMISTSGIKWSAAMQSDHLITKQRFCYLCGSDEANDQCVISKQTMEEF